MTIWYGVTHTSHPLSTIDTLQVGWDQIVDTGDMVTQPQDTPTLVVYFVEGILRLEGLQCKMHSLHPYDICYG